MKNKFEGFYSVDSETLSSVWKSEKTIFAFDTNVLLNLYGYAEQTREDFFKIVEALSEKVWLPYQVGLEYQVRRLKVIRNEKAVFNEIENSLQKIEKIFRSDFDKLALKRRFPKLFESTEKLEKEIGHDITNYRKSVTYWDKKQPEVRSHDTIRDKIDSCFSEKIGDKPLDQAWLDKLYEEGVERYKKKIPPGFEDTGKSEKGKETHFSYDGLHYERKYGDFILWKQLIEKSKSEDVENIIFVTDETKDDWWYSIESNGKKIIGPLAGLKAEILSETGIKNFHMYTTSQFLEDGKSKLEIEVKASSINDAIERSNAVERYDIIAEEMKNTTRWWTTDKTDFLAKKGLCKSDASQYLNDIRMIYSDLKRNASNKSFDELISSYTILETYDSRLEKIIKSKELFNYDDDDDMAELEKMEQAKELSRASKRIIMNHFSNLK